MSRARAWLRRERLLVALAVAAPALVIVTGIPAARLPALVDWYTIAALAGLMVLSRALEDSGSLARAGGWLLARAGDQRRLAAVLVTVSALLAAVITNDVALFVVVPLTLAAGLMTPLPVARLVVFEALAVNAGSAASPVGNPQNLFLWQHARAGFAAFTATLLPLGLALTAMLLALVPLAFPRAALGAHTPPAAGVDRTLLSVALAVYPVFLVLVDAGFALAAALAVIAVIAVMRAGVLARVDWATLAVFVVMFLDLALLARLPGAAAAARWLLGLPGGAFTAAVAASQGMSNVPATLFLAAFTDDWGRLAWGANVGGFGLAVGSMANLIALRLARAPGLWWRFHAWSLPVLAGAVVIALVLMRLPGLS
ncbi:SLC13 family permease [Arhodomonas aquaeolei]|uniref:SLC13 family permease n=1 Tax=Arhodomonas aquaeolei TaxID=2369 RepID=UPI002169CDCA|nr:SLC13 family permease [Arhodomonas aquaeolei]MCS4502623.1 SLC13 family permease [Arhodomonas aquaeolei]